MPTLLSLRKLILAICYSADIAARNIMLENLTEQILVNLCSTTSQYCQKMAISSLFDAISYT